MAKLFLSTIALVGLLSSAALAQDVKVGTNFAQIGATAGQTVTIVSAANNTAGVIIRGAQMWTASNASAVLVMQHPDGVYRPFFYLTGQGNGANGYGILPYPLTIPAGYGLAISSSAGGSSGVYLHYDLQK